MNYHAEYTDTLAGQANYSWCRQAEFTAPDDAPQSLILRRAKKALGLSGLRGQIRPWGNGYEFFPYRSATVLFVRPAE